MRDPSDPVVGPLFGIAAIVIDAQGTQRIEGQSTMNFEETGGSRLLEVPRCLL